MRHRLPRRRGAASARGDAARTVPTGAVVRRLGVVAVGCLIGILVVLAIGGITWHSSQKYGHQAHAQAHDVGTVPVAATSPAPTATPVSPTRIVIPALDASAPIIDVATSPDNELEVPQNPRVVGWWKPGARPGAAQGTAVLAGHINYAGVQGTFADIGKLKPGSRLTVYGSINDGNRQRVDFQVTGVRTYHKTTLPYRQIFDQTTVGRLALITCGGPFDNATGNYLDNIVVYAVPVTV